MGRRSAPGLRVAQAAPALGLSDLYESRDVLEMKSSLFHLRWWYLLGGGLERGARRSRVTRSLGGRQANVVVIALGHEQVQQRGAAFLICVSHRLTDLLGL